MSRACESMLRLFYLITLMATFWPPTLTDHAEFARCPQPLPMGSPSLPISSCELNKNTRRCHQQPLATHLSCRLYQTCDHAVLISGMTGFTSKLQESCFCSDILTSHAATFLEHFEHCRRLAAADHIPASCSESTEVLQNAPEQWVSQGSHQDLLQ